MAKTTTANPFEENGQSNQWVKWLLTHAWNIITKENLFKGRLSRGEYRIITLLFWAATSLIGLVLSPLWSVWSIISLLVWLVALVYHIGFGIKRSHDLDKSGWYWYQPLIAMLIIPIVMMILTFGRLFIVNAQDETQFRKQYDAGAPSLPWLNTSSYDVSAAPDTIIWSVWNAMNWVLWIIALWLLIWFLVIAIKLSFFKWTQWDNSYGADRLPSQPTSNSMYWWIGIGLAILSMVFSALNPSQQLQNDKFEQMMKQKMWWSMTIPSDDMMNQIDIDTTQPVDQQIDTAIQAQDASAIVDATIATGN
jgi:uncharacterized membrane protein YhaH (DUF805 family)